MSSVKKKATKKSEPKKLEPLIPPDMKQCQANKSNGNNFMTFGGVVGIVRCKEISVTVATEVQPDKDGRHGSMSLCTGCWAELIRRCGGFYASFEPITEEMRAPKKKRATA